MYTDKLFTGQREMAELGIYHFGARFYSPRLGRFLSADTIVPGAANPQSWNRFSYTLNNPLRYTDPSGHWENETNDPEEEQRQNARRHRAERERNRRDRGNGRGHGLNSLANNGGESTGGDENVGYTIRYDIGVTLAHYYGHYRVFNIQEIGADPLAYQALMDFEINAVARTNALDDIKSAQMDLVVSAGATVLGGALTGIGAATSLGGITTPLGLAEIAVGVALMVLGGGGVYDAAMAWGQAAEANRVANSNLSATWGILNNFP